MKNAIAEKSSNRIHDKFTDLFNVDNAVNNLAGVNFINNIVMPGILDELEQAGIDTYSHSFELVGDQAVFIRLLEKSATVSISDSEGYEEVPNPVIEIRFDLQSDMSQNPRIGFNIRSFPLLPDYGYSKQESVDGKLSNVFSNYSDRMRCEKRSYFRPKQHSYDRTSFNLYGDMQGVSDFLVELVKENLNEHDRVKMFKSLVAQSVQSIAQDSGHEFLDVGQAPEMILFDEIKHSPNS